MFLLLFLPSPAISLGFTILFLLPTPARSLRFTTLLLPSPAISLGFTILLLPTPAISLGFTILLLLPSQLYLWASPFFFLFYLPSYISGVHHSYSSAFLCYVSGVHHSSSFSTFPAICLGFIILLLLPSQLYLWGSPFFFFCLPLLCLWGSPFFFFCLPQLYLFKKKKNGEPQKKKNGKPQRIAGEGRRRRYVSEIGDQCQCSQHTLVCVQLLCPTTLFCIFGSVPVLFTMSIYTVKYELIKPRGHRGTCVHSYVMNACGFVGICALTVGCIGMHTDIQAHTCVCVHMRTHTHTHTHTHTQTHTHTDTHTHTHAKVYTHAYTHILTEECSLTLT